MMVRIFVPISYFNNSLCNYYGSLVFCIKVSGLYNSRGIIVEQRHFRIGDEKNKCQTACLADVGHAIPSGRKMNRCRREAPVAIVRKQLVSKWMLLIIC